MTDRLTDSPAAPCRYQLDIEKQAEQFGPQLLQLAKAVSSAVLGDVEAVRQLVQEADIVMNQLVDERAVLRKAEVPWPEARCARGSCSTHALSVIRGGMQGWRHPQGASCCETLAGGCGLIERTSCPQNG